MRNTILITGATGTVGRRVALELAKTGASVRAAVRDLDKAADLRDAGVDLVPMDFTDADSIRAAVQGVDRIFLLTPFVEAPVPMAEALVQAAKVAGVTFIVRMSALGADPESPMALAREHGLGEAVVKNSGIDWAVLQPSFFMENVIHYMGQSVREQAALYGASGSGRAGYIAADDIARTAASILLDPKAHAGETYVLTGPAAINNDDIARSLTQLLGKPVSAIDVEPEDHRRGLEGAGPPGWMVDSLAGLETVKRNGWAETTTAAVERITGRPPETLAGFLDRNAAAFA